MSAALNTAALRASQESSATKVSRLSKDGKWRSFAKVPCLLQYLNSGVYFARVKVNGKIIWHSLETGVWSTAKLKLADLIKDTESFILKGNG